MQIQAIRGETAPATAAEAKSAAPQGLAAKSRDELVKMASYEAPKGYVVKEDGSVACEYSSFNPLNLGMPFVRTVAANLKAADEAKAELARQDAENAPSCLLAPFYFLANVGVALFHCLTCGCFRASEEGKDAPAA